MVWWMLTKDIFVYLLNNLSSVLEITENEFWDISKGGTDNVLRAPNVKALSKYVPRDVKYAKISDWVLPHK